MLNHEETRVGHSRVAWQTLVRAARNAQLHGPTHSLVERMLGELVSRVRLAAGIAQPVDFDIGEGVVTLDERSMAIREHERDPLALALHACGFRRFSFRGTFDLFSASRLVELLAEFETGDAESTAERLRWEAFEGLTIYLAEALPGPLDAMDAITLREGDWMAFVRDPGPPEDVPPLLPIAFMSVWDGTGGVIPWPIKVPALEFSAIQQEVEAANDEGVPLSRLGMLLPDVFETSRDTSRAETLLSLVPGLADQMLTHERTADLPHLLQPLARWSDAELEEEAGDPLRSSVRSVLESLADDRRLSRLLAAIQGQRLTPEEARGWFSCLPVTGVGRIFEFASTVQRGTYREAITDAAMFVAGPRHLGLADVIRHAPIGPALLALEAVIAPEPSRESLSLAILALDRNEPALRARAARHLMPWESSSIGRRMVAMLPETNRELRSLALSWIARYQWQPAFEPLSVLVNSAQFTRLPLGERVELARTLGFVGGPHAVEGARSYLPPGWDLEELDRAVPWVTCLAATGLDDAEEYLDRLSAVAGGSTAQFAQEAIALWRRRRVEAEAGLEPKGSAPGLPQVEQRARSAPASPVPRRPRVPVEEA